MRTFLTVMLLSFVAPAAMAQQLSVIQKYLQNETGYVAAPAPIAQQPAAAPQPLYTETQPSYTVPSPMQQYIQRETGYVPQQAPQIAPAPVQSTVTSSASIVGMDF